MANMFKIIEVKERLKERLKERPSICVKYIPNYNYNYNYNNYSYNTNILIDPIYFYRLIGFVFGFTKPALNLQYKVLYAVSYAVVLSHLLRDGQNSVTDLFKNSPLYRILIVFGVLMTIIKN